MLVHHVRENHRVPLDYSEGASPVWMITDGCSTGVSGLVSQGDDWKTARIAAFYSAKLNAAQQNYPVHEIEMLAGVETMLRHVDILQGVNFRWSTDYKGLIYLLNQKNLSGRQARWLEKISSFTFEVVYIAGSENVVADALSRIYSNDSMGTERAKSEFTYHDVVDDDTISSERYTSRELLPVLAGVEAIVATRRGSRVRQPSQKAVMAALNNSTAVTDTPEPPTPVRTRKKSRFALKGPSLPDESTEGGNRSTEPLTPATENIENTELTMEVPPTEGTLIDIVSQSLHGLDLLAELRGKYELDPTFKPILEKPREFRNFEVVERLVYLRKQETKVLCIPKVVIQGRNAREIVIAEAHSMLAHLGASKTLDYLRDHVWWKDMVSDVRAFCETCHTCKISKPSNQKPYGLLNPLSVPSYPWESIGMDFVGPLPESGNRDGFFDSITVIICLLTSMVHLVPSRTTYNASQLAELMFEHVYKLHRLPKNIISDRDVLFTSTFWKRLHNLVGTKLKMSSAYHPQSDGSTERANRTITQMLRQCVHSNQKDWVAKLPAIEFAVNSARSESTGFAPFFLNSGRMPRSMIWDSPASTEFPAVRNFALQKKLAIMSAHDSILSARVKQTRDANRKRRIAPFQQGELVYLSTKNISFAKGLARKLLPKFIGPYKILQDFGNSSFKLELPAHLKRRGIHDVFHSSLLREHLPNDDRLFPGRLDTQVGSTPEVDGEWAVDRILSHSGSKTDSIFEIKWKTGDVTWLPYYQITHLQALTEYLDLLGKKDIRKLPYGSGKPPRDDPQLTLGSISLDFHGALSPYKSVLECLKSSLQTVLQVIIAPVKSLLSTAYQLSYSTNILNTMPAIRRGRPYPRAVQHPLLTRTSATNFLMRDLEYPVHTNIHVAQMAEYIQFDQYIRANGDAADLSSIPIGYTVFSTAWNKGAAPNDRRRFSTITLEDNPIFNYAIPSNNPVRLSDLQITQEQAGITTAALTPPPTSTLQQEITEEFAALMVTKQKKLRQHFEARQERRRGFTEYKPPARFHPIPPPNHNNHHNPSRNHHRNNHRNNQRHGNRQHNKDHHHPAFSSNSTWPTTSSAVVVTEDPPSAPEYEEPEVPDDEEVPEDEEDLPNETETHVDDDFALVEPADATAPMEVNN